MRAPLLTALLLALPGCAGWTDREPRILFYRCNAEAEGAFGRIEVHATVSANGRRVTFWTMWTAQVADGALSMRIDWRAGLVAPPPGARLHLAWTIPAGRRAWSRIEIRGDGFSGPPAYATAYFNPPGTRFETLRWRRFADATAGAPAPHIALVRRDRVVVAEALLPRAIATAPAEAMAAVRPRLEADLADYSNRCQREEDWPLVIA